MIVENIPEAKAELVKEIILNFKRYIAYMFTSVSSIVLAAVMFFYVEECYFMVEIPPQYSQNCQDLCSGIEKLNQTITMGKNDHQSENITHNVRNLMEICASTSCIEVPGKDQTTCEITDTSHFEFSTYFELAFSIVYTIG